MQDRSCPPHGESPAGFCSTRLALAVAIFSLALPFDGAWKLQDHLFADDAVEYDVFGEAVAISGDTIVVGAKGDNTGTLVDAGSAYVFVRSGGTWSQQDHLFADDAVAGDQFGGSVAISGDTIVVGAIEDNSSAGSAYVFVRSGGVWSQQDHLFADDASAFDEFGTSVAIDGDTIAVGARKDNTAEGNLAGSAYVFARSGSTWSQQGHLFADDATENDFFGTSVAVSYDAVVVGAPTAAGALSYAGAAYVFTRSGSTWSQQERLIADDASNADMFGNSVSILSNTVVVGAPDDDTSSGGPDAGSVYVFTGSGSTWSQQGHLFADDAKPNDEFGGSVSIDANTVVAGAHYDDTSAAAHAGSAYVFTRSGGGWVQQDHLFAYDAEVEDYFGRSVAISGRVAVVGADYDDTTVGSGAGSVYVFGFAPLELFVGPPDLLSGR